MGLKEIVESTNEAVKAEIRAIYTYVTNQVANSELPLYNTPSRVSEWSIWVAAISFIAYIQRQMWDSAKSELLDIRDKGIAANKYFFARSWKSFQYGDQLMIDDATGRYFYTEPDASKQIVNRLAITNGVNNWVIKVAKLEDESPVPLDALELDAFREFVELTSPPGPQPLVISRPSDKIKVGLTIVYDPITPLSQIIEAVESAYMDYLATIDIEGVSRYYTIKHVDAIQAVGDVIVDVIVEYVEAKIEGDSFGNANRLYEPASGYIELDPDSKLSELIKYVPR